jgi:hypothetical protein
MRLLMAVGNKREKVKAFRLYLSNVRCGIPFGMGINILIVSLLMNNAPSSRLPARVDVAFPNMPVNLQF